MKMANLSTVAIGMVLAVQPVQAKPREGLRAVVGFTNGCGTSDKQAVPLLLLSALIAPAVKAGINGLGAALQKAGQPDEAQVSAMIGTMFYSELNNMVSRERGMDINAAEVAEVSPRIAHSCIVVAVHGTSNDGALKRGDYGQDHAKFFSEGGFNTEPSFFMASAIEISPDRSAWRLKPELLKIGSPLTKSSWARGSGRELVASFVMAGPSVKEGDAILATRSIRIGPALFKSGKVTSGTELEGLATSWMPMPVFDDSTRAALAAATKRLEDRAKLIKARDEAKLANNTKLANAADMEINALNSTLTNDINSFAAMVPVTLGFTIHETRDGNAFIEGIGKFLSENSDAIAKPISDALDPAARTAAQIAAGEAETKLRVDAITNVAAWEASVSEGESSAKQRIAKLEAINACNTLKLNKFFEVDCLKVQ